jgi:hypothetical protein
MSKPKILTYEQYEKIEHKRPYIFELKSKNKHLLYIGFGHSNNIDNPDFTILKNEFVKFKPNIVFIEGITDFDKNKQQVLKYLKNHTLQQATKKMEERGFISKLAYENGIEIYSPEPSFKKEIEHLLSNGFKKDEIFAFDLYRTVVQHHRNKVQDPIENYLHPYIGGFKRYSNWSNFEYTTANLQKIGERIWGKNNGSINVENKWRVDPVKRKGLPWTNVNLVSQQSGYFRDEYICKQIRKYLKKYNKVFVVFGASHAVMQEPYLRKAFKDTFQ